jgi:hypothetical protein
MLHLLKRFLTKARPAALRRKCFRPIPLRRSAPLLLEPLEDRLSPAVLLSTYSGLSFDQVVNSNATHGTVGGGPRQLGDVNMAVGINYVAVAGSDGVSFINKVTGQVVITKTFDQMFGTPPPLNPGPGYNPYLDPTVNFDQQYNQFVLTTLNSAADTNNTTLDFALIPDSNPLTFQFAPYTLTNAVWPAPYVPGWGDFDRVGWNNDAYFIAMNMPTNTSGVWNGCYVMTVPKVDVHSSPPPSGYQSLVRLPDFKSDPVSFPYFLNYSVQPAIMHGVQSGQMWFVGTPIPPSAYSSLSSGEDSGNYGSSYLNVIGLTYSSLQNITTNSFQPYSTTLPIQFFQNPNGVNQQGSTVRLDVNDTRMLKAEWQSNRLVCTNTVGLSATATDSAVGWYEFSTANPSAPVCTQEGFLAGPSGTSKFFPSIAIAPDGDLGMTYLESSPSEYLSMYVTGQPVSQYGVVSALGYEKMEPPQLVVRSIDAYTLNGDAQNHIPARLGDFSNVTPDPVTGDFWAANEWTNEAQGSPQATDAWDTQVAHFSMFPSVSATQNSRGDPVTFIISANDGTLWEYDRDFTPGSGANPYCQQISTGQFSASSATQDASGNAVVFAVLSGTHVAGVPDYNQTLWEYDPAFPGTHWVQLLSSLFSSSSPFGAISATRDAQGRPALFAVMAAQRNPADGSTLTNSQTLWLYDDNSGPGQGNWSELLTSPWAAVSATRDAGGAPVTFAITAPPDGTMTQSLWEHTGANWNEISSSPFTAVSATRDGSNNPVVFGILETPGTYANTIWEWSATTNMMTGLSTPGQFYQFTSLSATQEGSGNAPVLFAVAYGMQSPQNPTAQTLDYKDHTGWREVSTAENTTVSATRDASGSAVAFGVRTDGLILGNDPDLNTSATVWTQPWS